MKSGDNCSRGRGRNLVTFNETPSPAPGFFRRNPDVLCLFTLAYQKKKSMQGYSLPLHVGNQHRIKLQASKHSKNQVYRLGNTSFTLRCSWCKPSVVRLLKVPPSSTYGGITFNAVPPLT